MAGIGWCGVTPGIWVGQVSSWWMMLGIIWVEPVLIPGIHVGPQRVRPGVWVCSWQVTPLTDVVGHSASGWWLRVVVRVGLITFSGCWCARNQVSKSGRHDTSSKLCEGSGWFIEVSATKSGKWIMRSLLWQHDFDWLAQTCGKRIREGVGMGVRHNYLVGKCYFELLYLWTNNVSNTLQSLACACTRSTTSICARYIFPVTVENGLTDPLYDPRNENIFQQAYGLSYIIIIQPFLHSFQCRNFAHCDEGSGLVKAISRKHFLLYAQTSRCSRMFLKEILYFQYYNKQRFLVRFRNFSVS